MQIDTTAVGTNSGNIIITNNDPSHNPFSFPVSGVITSIPTDIVSLSALPLNGGIVSIGGTNGGAFPVGSTQTVTATANLGFEFAGWSGDASGTSNPLTVVVNRNLNIIANFVAIGGNITLTVTTNGSGTVSPNLNGKNLKAGRSYTLIATAKTGNVFSNWTGSITTNKNPLTFKLESSMVLQANFVTNPFLPVKGTYNGLFTTTNGVTEQTAGMLKRLVVNQTGTYSGTLLINGGSHGLSGTFNLDGQATKGISRPASQGGNLLVEMTLVTSSNSAPQVTGTVIGTTWVANLTADRATNTVPSTQYTMLIPPDTNNAPPANSPGGDGYALITNHLGTATITGALADGTVLSQTTSVSQDGYVPIYANLYGSKGVLLGWINLLTNTDGVSLTWIHPGRPSGLYMNGFTNVLLTNQIFLSPWVNSSGTIALLTNLSILDTINGSNTPISVTINSGKVTGPSVSGTVNPKTGLLTVTIGSGAAKVTGHGAILLTATNGGGYFLTKTNAQAIKLEP